MELDSIKLQTTWNDAAASINSNTQKIGTEIDKIKASTYKNKGYFKTLALLQSTYPTASVGSIAYVGASYPYIIYTWSATTRTWETDGTTGGNEDIDLTQYYTKEETHKAIKDEYIVLTQEDYDALTTKEDKLYFCTED